SSPPWPHLARRSPRNPFCPWPVHPPESARPCFPVHPMSPEDGYIRTVGVDRCETRERRPECDRAQPPPCYSPCSWRPTGGPVTKVRWQNLAADQADSLRESPAR